MLQHKVDFTMAVEIFKEKWHYHATYDQFCQNDWDDGNLDLFSLTLVNIVASMVKFGCLRKLWGKKVKISH